MESSIHPFVAFVVLLVTVGFPMALAKILDVTTRDEDERALANETGSRSNEAANKKILDAPNASKSQPVLSGSLDEAWKVTENKLEEAVLAIGDYEINPQKAIDYPAFNDVTVPATKDMIQALKKALRIRNLGRLEKKQDMSQVREFMAAVDDLMTAIDAAERTAHNLRWSNLSKSEQKDLSVAHHLLKHASDPANSKEVRLNYYGKLQEVVRRLNDNHGAVLIPIKAMLALEGGHTIRLDDEPALPVSSVEGESSKSPDGVPSEDNAPAFTSNTILVNSIVEVPDFPVSYALAVEAMEEFASNNPGVMTGGDVVLTFRYSFPDMMTDSFTEGLSSYLNANPQVNWLLQQFDGEDHRQMVEKLTNLAPGLTPLAPGTKVRSIGKSPIKVFGEGVQVENIKPRQHSNGADRT